MSQPVQPLQLLVVEDSARDVRVLRALFEETGHAIQIVQCARISEALDALRAQKFDCALVDLGLPDGDGTENVARVRAADRGLAIVVLTGRDDDQAALDALRRGAQEYAVKGEHDGEELLRIVLHAIERHRMVRELDIEREREYHRASHDPLTGLPNRQLFMDRARLAIHQAERGKGRCGICFMDLDGFKQVNDQHGHAVGDDLLRLVANVLQETVRGSDTVARHGGDEFLVLLTPIPSAEEAEVIINRIIARIAALNSIAGVPIRIGASAGLALYPEHGESLDQLTASADHAMYDAKRAGKGVLRIYGDRNGAEPFDATCETGMTLRYQPWQDVAGNYGGLEVFVRKMPGEGFAQEALADAERAKGMEALACWVLRRACGEWQQLSQRGLAPPRLSINVSDTELSGHNFASTRLEVMAQSGFHPSRLQLEISEPVLQGMTENMLTQLRQLRAAGVWIAADNLGRGTVSLRTLASLPLDALKLDPSVIIGLRKGDAPLRAWLTGLYAFARQIDKPLMFTGVETDADRKLCQEFPGVGIQGHWLALSVSAESLAMTLNLPPRVLRAA